MNRRKITLPVSIFFRGAVHQNGDVAEVFFQRQGISESFFANIKSPCGQYAAIEKHGYGEQGTLANVRIGNKEVGFVSQDHKIRCAKDRQAAASPVNAALLYAGNALGMKLTARQESMAYMFDDYTDDTILSPFVYEPSTDTIRVARENYCLVHFIEGDFDVRNLKVDVAATPFLPYIEKALQEGFHSCDRKRGDDYCKRRLAWLAGAYFIEEKSKHGEVFVGLLNGKMEWPAARV